MHTDEFEISLARELTVCKNTIKEIKKSLEILERKHNKTTQIFIKEIHCSTLTNLSSAAGDGQTWLSCYESLKRWEKLECQYQEIFQMMKI
ncbi:MAG TPA: hypothetical protein VLX29_05625 [Nitrospirota bacterium]|nr:hypothetical protein [Nitrospirota bacterium]